MSRSRASRKSRRPSSDRNRPSRAVARANVSFVELLEERLLLSTYWVTTAADSGAGSLRQAILQADAAGGANIIDFNIAGTAQITLHTALPAVTDALSIDATTQSGYAGNPVVWLDGSQLTSPSSGLTIQAGGCVIRGLAISGFAGKAAIELDGPGGNIVQGDYLGISPAGAVATPNEYYGIVAASNGDTIGGTVAGQGNVISGNDVSGVMVQGVADSVIDNFIGVDPTGEMALSNGGNGIEVSAPAGQPAASATIQGNVISTNGAGGIAFISNFAASVVSGNRIGTDVTGSFALGNTGDGIYVGPSDASAGGVNIVDNVISANWGDGVRLDGAVNAVVAGNLIGTDVTGESTTDPNGAQLGNYGDGVNIVDAATGNLIGGPATADMNVISGNDGDGVGVQGGPGNSVAGNYIGTDAAGAVALSNEGNGVNVQSSGNSVLGNVVSGNMGVGVDIGYLLSPADDNVVQGNLIGVGADGATAIPNQTDGVSIDGSGNLIGGAGTGQGNVIAFNMGNGVTVDSGTQNMISRNSIYSNSSPYEGYPGIGIDLGYNGVTLNDSLGHTGPNLYENFPVLVSATSQGSTLTVTGTLESWASQSFTVEFFGNVAADPSGYGQGQTFLGSAVVTTDAGGQATFTAVLACPPAGEDLVTATATDAAGNTSEFGADIGIVQAPANTASLSGYVYNDANDNGVMDSGEAGIAGVTVTLWGTSGSAQSRRSPRLPPPMGPTASAVSRRERTQSPRPRRQVISTGPMPWEALAERSATIRLRQLRCPRPLAA